MTNLHPPTENNKTEKRVTIWFSFALLFGVVLVFVDWHIAIIFGLGWLLGGLYMVAYYQWKGGLD